MINDFKNKLFNYANKHKTTEQELPSFKFNDTTYIDGDIVMELAFLLSQMDVLQEMFQKECDYNRLLRKENQELTSELEQILNNYDEDEDNDVEFIESNSNILS